VVEVKILLVVTTNTRSSVVPVMTVSEGMSMAVPGKTSSDRDGPSVGVAMGMLVVEEEDGPEEIGTMVVRERALRSLEENGRSKSESKIDEDSMKGFVSRELVMSGKIRNIELLASGAVDISMSTAFVTVWVKVFKSREDIDGSGGGRVTESGGSMVDSLSLIVMSTVVREVPPGP